jgi:SAM-dependent methyltransferase
VSRILVLRHTAPEAALSPEFCYLLSWVDAELRSFARSTQRTLERLELERVQGTLANPRDGDLWLVLGNERLLVARRTLSALAGAITSGADAAVAARLADGPVAAPVHTLRGFERLETAVLAGPVKPAAALGPLVMLSVAGARRLLPATLEQHPAAGGLRWPRLPEDLQVAQQGLYHEFADYYGQAREDILPHVPAGTQRVLEVGCARGATGRLLRERRGCTVVGVELNPLVARAAARHLDRVITADVSELDPAALGEDPFDLVLALELFEHLAEPERFLELARRLLRPGGTVLLSVPNVGHHAVVLDLLAGRWDYLPIGLLCSTHLRFFTRRTLESWLDRLGFDDYTLIPQHGDAPAELQQLAAAVEVDAESLRTLGFYVQIRV